MSWRSKPVTQSQVDLLKKQPVEVEIPKTRGEASDLIDKLREELNSAAFSPDWSESP